MVMLLYNWCNLIGSQQCEQTPTLCGLWNIYDCPQQSSIKELFGLTNFKYGKPCVKQQLKNRQNNDRNDKW